MIRGFFAAALLGLITLALAVLGVAFVIPALLYRRWRGRMHASHG